MPNTTPMKTRLIIIGNGVDTTNGPVSGFAALVVVP
jgi:hypothetical protein